ncbi:hypothetical protein DRN73_10170, partial [Candidatus Pacearchaeota archaeon]
MILFSIVVFGGEGKSSNVAKNNKIVGKISELFSNFADNLFQKDKDNWVMFFFLLILIWIAVFEILTIVFKNVAPGGKLLVDPGTKPGKALIGAVSGIAILSLFYGVGKDEVLSTMTKIINALGGGIGLLIVLLLGWTTYAFIESSLGGDPSKIKFNSWAFTSALAVIFLLLIEFDSMAGASLANNVQKENVPILGWYTLISSLVFLTLIVQILIMLFMGQGSASTSPVPSLKRRISRKKFKEDALKDIELIKKELLDKYEEKIHTIIKKYPLKSFISHYNQELKNRLEDLNKQVKETSEKALKDYHKDLTSEKDRLQYVIENLDRLLKEEINITKNKKTKFPDITLSSLLTPPIS